MPNNSMVVSAGDDLFKIAAVVYGDPMGWTLIARANGLTDPIIQSDNILSIPDYNAARANDGILANQ